MSVGGLDAGSAVLEIIPQLARDFGSKFKTALAPLSKDLDETAQKTGDSFASKLGGGIMSAKGAIAGLGLGALAFGLSQTGVALDAMGSKTKTVFGESTKTVNDWAANSAKAMGIGKIEAAGLAANMGDLLVPMGFTRDAAAKMSTEMIGLSGALSTWSAGKVSTAETAEILQAALLGERDSLQSLGISISAAEIEAELLRKGQNKLTGSALQQAEAQATQTLIFAKSTDAQAEAADGADTLYEKQQLLKGTFNAVKEAAATFATKGLYAAFEAGQKLKPMIDILAVAVDAFRGGFENPDAINNVKGMEGVFLTLGATVATAFNTAKLVVSSFFDAFKAGDGSITSTGLAGWAEKAGYLASVAIPALWSGIQTLSAAFMESARFVIEHKRAFEIGAAVIFTIFLPALIAMGVQSVASSIMVAASWVTTQVAAVASLAVQSASAVATVAHWAAMAVGAVVKSIVIVASWAATAAAAIANVAIMVAQGVIFVATWVLMGAQSLLAAARVAAAWLIALGPIGIVIAAVVAVVALIILNWDTIKRVTEDLWNKVKDATSAAWGALKNMIGNALDNVKTLFLNFTGPGLIIKHWDTIRRATAEAWDSIRSKVDSVVGSFSSIPGRISAATSGMFNGIKDSFRSAINYVIERWNNLSFRMGSVDTKIPGIGTVGGFSIDTPNIPMLAKGGQLPAGLGIVGELGPELIKVNSSSHVFPNDELMNALNGPSERQAVEYHLHIEEGVTLRNPLIEEFKQMERLQIPIPR